MLIDTHTHIDMENFKNRFDEVLQTAAEYGVGKVVIPGVDLSGCGRIIEIFEKFEKRIGCSASD